MVELSDLALSSGSLAEFSQPCPWSSSPVQFTGIANRDMPLFRAWVPIDGANRMQNQTRWAVARGNPKLVHIAALAFIHSPSTYFNWVACVCVMLAPSME